MKKKWITKAEVSKILKTYSVRKDEFIHVGNKEYFFQSQFIKGYTISIAEETINAPDYFKKTGRVIVSHMQSNGKKTYNDVWEREQNGELQFCFRNLWNQPLSDADYIKELEEKYHKILIIGKKFKDELEETKNKSDFLDLSQKNIQLQKENKILKEKLATYTGHNARGAGRKPSQERLNAIEQMETLLKSGLGEQDIMNTLGISRATFYRYKKSINN